MNNKPKMVLFIILLSAILEKAVWRVAGMRLSLYFIIGLIVVCYVFIHQKGIIQFQPQTQILFKNRLWLLMFSAFQLMIINHGDDFLSQYVKGFIELFLFIIVFLGLYQFLLLKCKRVTITEFLDLVCCVGAVNVGYNIIQLVNNDIDKQFVKLIHSEVSRYGLDEYGHMGRLTGLFTDSNNNGVFLVLTIITILYRLRVNTNVSNQYKWALHVLMALSSIVLALTFSRTAWMGMFVFLVLYFFHYSFTARLKLLIIGSIMIIVGIYYYNVNSDFSSIIDERLKNISITNIENDSHFSVTLEAINIWFSSIIVFVFGTGINCLSVYYQNYYARAGYKAHSYFLQNFSEFGLLGGMIVIAFLAHLYRIARASNNKDISFFGKALLISLVCMNFTYDSMVQPLFYIVILTIIMGSFQENRKEICNNG